MATTSAGTARALSSPHTAPNKRLHHAASRCNTLQHTATCSRHTMQHTALLSNVSARAARALQSQHTPSRALKTDACKYNRVLRVEGVCVSVCLVAPSCFGCACPCIRVGGMMVTWRTQHSYVGARRRRASARRRCAPTGADQSMGG